MVEGWAPMSTFCLIYWNWIEANWVYLELKTLVLILILPLTFCVTLGKSLSSSEFSVLICKMDSRCTWSWLRSLLALRSLQNQAITSWCRKCLVSLLRELKVNMDVLLGVFFPLFPFMNKMIVSVLDKSWKKLEKSPPPK